MIVNTCATCLKNLGTHNRRGGIPKPGVYHHHIRWKRSSCHRELTRWLIERGTWSILEDRGQLMDTSAQILTKGQQLAEMLRESRIVDLTVILSPDYPAATAIGQPSV